MSNRDYHLSPVGFARQEEGAYGIEVLPEFREALLGLEGFSYVLVLWWSHHVDTPELRATRVCESPYRDAPAQLGIFATRSPVRPNPICVTVAPVIRVDAAAGRIELGYIDAEDGSPVMDIKPYQPCSDRVRAVDTPAWCQSWPQWFEDSGEFDWSTVFDTAQ